MPGHYIHMAAADRIAAHMRRIDVWPRYLGERLLDGPSPVELAAIAQRHRNYYSIGAIGPDLFFFLPDFRAPGLANSLIGVLGFIDDLFEALEPFIEIWDKYFGPIGQNLDEAVSRLTGDLSSVVGEIFGSLSSILTNAILDFGTQAHDWWGEFSLGLNRGYDNKDFFWSDMLHYRKTSRFGRSLWELANEAAAGGEGSSESADRLRAYALGYITHLGTDVTGHPFVNEKSGGPFRTHWQRHHLVENHMDARCYDDDHGSDANYNTITASALHFRILFGEDEGRTLPPYTPGDDSMRGRYVRSRQLDVDSELPEDVARLLFEAMLRTYRTDGPSAASIDDPSETTPQIIPDGDGRPPVELIQQTFGLVFRYLKRVTVDGFAQGRPLPPDVFPNLDFPVLTDPHDTAPGAEDDMDFWDYLLAILRFLLFIVEVAVWLATVIPGILNDLGTYGPRVLTYYTIDLPLYYMVKAQRAILVMTGYLLPMKDEIDVGLIRLGTGSLDVFLVNSAALDDLFGGFGEAANLAGILSRADDLMASGLDREASIAQALFERGVSAVPPLEPVRDAEFPRSIEIDAELRPIEYHAPWVYPDSPREEPSTTASPHAPGDTPDVLLRGTMPGDQLVRASFEQASSPMETDSIGRAIDAERNMGDPINFSTYLIWQLTRDDFEDSKESRIADWNLDADRGYAYKCWDWDRCKGRERKDETGNTYLATESQTPQEKSADTTINPLYSPSQPLEIHYLDQEGQQAPRDCDNSDEIPPGAPRKKPKSPGKKGGTRSGKGGGRRRDR